MKPDKIPNKINKGSSSIWLIKPIDDGKIASKLKKVFVIKYATSDETRIGANEANDWWRNMTSLAKTSPAIGAPNPEEIAAATPEPRKIW